MNAPTCCSTAPLRTSFWIVTFTLTRFEWGSVHTNAASTSRTWLKTSSSEEQLLCFHKSNNKSTSLDIPLIFLRQRASNSRDSSAATIHMEGGCKYLKITQIKLKKCENKQRISPWGYLSQDLQKYSIACFGIPSVMSTFCRRHATHIFAGFGSMSTPHSQHNLTTKNIVSPLLHRQ